MGSHVYMHYVYSASTSGLCLANTQSTHQNISYDDLKKNNKNPSSFFFLLFTLKHQFPPKSERKNKIFQNSSHKR